MLHKGNNGIDDLIKTAVEMLIAKVCVPGAIGMAEQKVHATTFLNSFPEHYHPLERGHFRSELSST